MVEMSKSTKVESVFGQAFNTGISADTWPCHVRAKTDSSTSRFETTEVAIYSDMGMLGTQSLDKFQIQSSLRIQGLAAFERRLIAAQVGSRPRGWRFTEIWACLAPSRQRFGQM